MFTWLEYKFCARDCSVPRPVPYKTHQTWVGTSIHLCRAEERRMERGGWGGEDGERGMRRGGWRGGDEEGRMEINNQHTIQCMVRSWLTISTSKAGSKRRDQFSWTYFFCQSYWRRHTQYSTCQWLVVISFQLTSLLSKIWYMSLLRWLVSKLSLFSRWPNWCRLFTYIKWPCKENRLG